MILMRSWRKSWELEKWPSRSPLGGSDWSVRGPWWPILSACGGRAERDTWHHTLCPPVCKRHAEFYYNGLRNIIQYLIEGVGQLIPVLQEQDYFQSQSLHMKRFNKYNCFLYILIGTCISKSSKNCILHWTASILFLKGQRSRSFTNTDKRKN